MKKRIFLIMGLSVALLTGCQVKKAESGPKTEVDFTVVKRDDIPEELKSTIESKKTEEFSMTFGTGEELFLVKGYGTVPTGGYSIRVDSILENKDEVFFKTMLVGPKASEPVNKLQTYPYIVVKIEYTDKKVVFE